MSELVKVDVHMHLYETKSVGHRMKAAYETWEYGANAKVRFSSHGGDVQDAAEAMTQAGFSNGIAVNLFGLNLFREEAVARLPQDLRGKDRERAVADIEASMPDRLRAFNLWLCRALADVPNIVPYVAVDPWVLSSDANVAHLRELADLGARGVKIHPIVQNFQPDDPRMLPVYRACLDLDLVMLSHSGAARRGKQIAAPGAFAGLLGDFPDLTVVLAHLGGGTWREALDVARAFPNVLFDISEIIEWTGAPNAPSREELAGLIREIGPERVMLGTDFPWYDLDHTEERLMSLPLLGDEEKEAILGLNAVRLLLGTS